MRDPPWQSTRFLATMGNEGACEWGFVAAFVREMTVAMATRFCSFFSPSFLPIVPPSLLSRVDPFIIISPHPTFPTPPFSLRYAPFYANRPSSTCLLRSLAFLFSSLSVHLHSSSFLSFSLRYAPFYANSGYYYLIANAKTEYFAWTILTSFDLLHITGR
jgi:hypothetical protein